MPQNIHQIDAIQSVSKHDPFYPSGDMHQYNHELGLPQSTIALGTSGKQSKCRDQTRTLLYLKLHTKESTHASKLATESCRMLTQKDMLALFSFPSTLGCLTSESSLSAPAIYNITRICPPFISPATSGLGYFSISPLRMNNDEQSHIRRLRQNPPLLQHNPLLHLLHRNIHLLDFPKP